ncbi:hexokinase-2-like [Heptranchias perlo]|uniref:hexokinase-2-like n=1 Tax=Heptranchias perlo TaxID=212740 RepID=UPI003559FC93
MSSVGNKFDRKSAAETRGTEDCAAVWKEHRNQGHRERIENVLQDFSVSEQKLREISTRMEQEMENGRGKKRHKTVLLKAKPNGTEKGEFLVLDLWRTKFRIEWVKITEKPNCNVPTESEVYNIPEQVKLGTGAKIFDHIAESLAQFLEKRKIKEKILPLGVTFSFLCEQKNLNEGELLRSTDGLEGKALDEEKFVELLQRAIEHQGGYDVAPVSVFSESVVSMMSCAFQDHRCEIGLILGAGTELCYMEEVCNIDFVEGDDRWVCVDMEWAEFGLDGFLDHIRTEFDMELDKWSQIPGHHLFEQMICHIGEIVRLVLVKLASENLLFGGVTSAAVLTKGMFGNQLVCELEGDAAGLEGMKRRLRSMGLNPSDRDCATVWQVCSVVSTRSANLCAAGLTAILTKIRNNKGSSHVTTVGVSGTIYRKHPKFSETLTAAMKQLAPDCDVRFLVSEEGSGKGVAVAMAVSSRRAARRRAIDRILKPFKLSEKQLVEVRCRMREEMELGLRGDTHQNANIRMLPTFVRSLLDGTERGTFLALDLGGTNFRVLLVNISSKAEGGVKIVNETHRISQDVMQGTEEQVLKETNSRVCCARGEIFT